MEVKAKTQSMTKNMKVLKKKIKKLPSGNPFDFTDLVERKKEEEIDLGSFFELAEESKIVYNQTPVNVLKGIFES